MTTLTAPTSHPAEILEISPEALEVANAYLQTQSAAQVSEDLNIDQRTVATILARREVKAYIDQVFFDIGFNNRFKMRAAMDAIIAKKFEELDDAGIGSNKDILEILALSHKMTMESLQKEIELKKLEGSQVKSQTNIQINDSKSNYSSLLERLISGNV
jgi:hypothetical protein